MSLPFPVNSVVCSDWIEFLRQLPDESVQCCVTSPPYWNLRDYGTATWEGGDSAHEHDRIAARNGRGGSGSPGKQTEGAFPSDLPVAVCSCGAHRIDQQLGLERTPEEYVAKVVAGFREVRRVLRRDGVCWINLGDSYATGTSTASKPSTGVDVGYWQKADKVGRSRIDGRQFGLKPKDLVGIPWMIAFALRADGWYLRAQCPWIKRNAMPESCTDRPGTATETIFLFSKSARYFYDHEAVKMPAAGTAHERGDGVNPKAKACGANSRIFQDRDPSHPQERKNEASGLRRYAGFNARWDATEAKRSRQNESFSAAVSEVVGTRGRRNHDWFMDSWQGLLTDEDGDPVAFVVNPAAMKEAHFATFPPKLVEPCILAGTSEKGCCPECGAPWERVTESSGETNERDRSNKCDFIEGVTQGGNASGIRTLSGATYRPQRVATDRWQPTCTCNAGDPVPCVVCDPFSGAGTVKLVALAHGRQFIGAELNPEYIEISNRRTWSAEHGGMKAPDEQQAGLFEEARER